MRRLILVAVLVTVLLVAFAGSALADGPHGYGMGYGGGYGSGGYGGYNMGYGGYNMGYGGYNMGYGGGYGGYQKPHYPKYNYCQCYVYNPCPKNNVYVTPYGGYMGYGGGYGMQSGYMSYGGWGY